MPSIYLGIAGLSLIVLGWMMFGGRAKKETPKKELVSKRVLFAVTCWITVFFTLYFTINQFADQYSSATISFGLWIIFVAKTIKFFMVSVPEITGLVTINLFYELFKRFIPNNSNDNREFLRSLRVYSTGLHFKFPWEQVKEGNYINLRLATPKERTETYPSKDGPLIHVKWSYHLRPRLTGLPAYISSDDTTIDQGFADVGSSFLSKKISGKDVSEVKVSQADIEKEMIEHFANHKPSNGGSTGEASDKTLEQLYGVDLVKATLIDVDYDPEYQKVLNTEQVAKKLEEIAQRLQGGDVTEKDALETAMIINRDVKKTITENVHQVKGEGLEGVVSFLGAFAKGDQQ